MCNSPPIRDHPTRGRRIRRFLGQTGRTLRRVTDLFLIDGERLWDDQVTVFDEVLCLLIARVETRARRLEAARHSTTRRSR